MTFEIFLALLAVFSVFTGLFVEAVKISCDAFKITYASNIIALWMSALVGGCGTVIFIVWNDLAWTTQNIITVFLMVCANWLVAMLGYDKVIQALKQLKGGK